MTQHTGAPHRMAPHENEAALTVDAVDVRYRDVVALTGASLTLAPGRVCGLVGMNGAISMPSSAWVDTSGCDEARAGP